MFPEVTARRKRCSSNSMTVIERFSPKERLSHKRSRRSRRSMRTDLKAVNNRAQRTLRGDACQLGESRTEEFFMGISNQFRETNGQACAGEIELSGSDMSSVHVHGYIRFRGNPAIDDRASFESQKVADGKPADRDFRM
jgi:hypothetical protein